jgi:hypothetical protein
MNARVQLKSLPLAEGEILAPTQSKGILEQHPHRNPQRPSLVIFMIPGTEHGKHYATRRPVSSISSLPSTIVIL